jgi:hypothetical protein
MSWSGFRAVDGHRGRPVDDERGGGLQPGQHCLVEGERRCPGATAVAGTGHGWETPRVVGTRVDGADRAEVDALIVDGDDAAERGIELQMEGTVGRPALVQQDRRGADAGQVTAQDPQHRVVRQAPQQDQHPGPRR